MNGQVLIMLIFLGLVIPTVFSQENNFQLIKGNPVQTKGLQLVLIGDVDHEDETGKRSRIELINGIIQQEPGFINVVLLEGDDNSLVILPDDYSSATCAQETTGLDCHLVSFWDHYLDLKESDQAMMEWEELREKIENKEREKACKMDLQNKPGTLSWLTQERERHSAIVTLKEELKLLNRQFDDLLKKLDILDFQKRNRNLLKILEKILPLKNVRVFVVAGDEHFRNMLENPDSEFEDQRKILGEIAPHFLYYRTRENPAVLQKSPEERAKASEDYAKKLASPGIGEYGDETSKGSLRPLMEAIAKARRERVEAKRVLYKKLKESPNLKKTPSI